MVEDDRIKMLLQQADRALEMFQEPTVNPSKEAETTTVVTTEHLKKVIENLELQLKAKTALCNKLEATVNKLLHSIDKLNSTGCKLEWNLSEEYFREVMQTYKAQLWFRKPLPPIIDGIYERLKARMEHEYEVEKRRTAFTMIECQNAVNQIRVEWEESLPVAVARSLTSENRVFASAADRSSKTGDVCEVVHYLVYLVFKMYNRASHILHSLKKKEAISLTSDESMIASKVQKSGEPSKESNESSVSIKWYHNPHTVLCKLVESARKSVYYSRSLYDEESCRNAITISVGKLMSKPTLNESLELLASIIALKEYVQVKKWRLELTNMMHRNIFQFKMLEVWHLIDCKDDWNTFRTSFFKAINSILSLVLIVRPEITEPVVKQLASVVKPSNRKEFDASCLALFSDRNIEPLFLFLEKTLATTPIPEYMSTYSWLFVYLGQTLALQFDAVANHETVLLNLVEDLRIDVKLMSALEKKDYVRAISITCSVIVGSINTPNTASGEENVRAKFAASTFFLCTRIGYLLNRTTKDGNKFWHESPLPGYCLIDYCEETTLRKVKKHSCLLRLPRFDDMPCDESDFEILGPEENVSTSKSAVEEKKVSSTLDEDLHDATCATAVNIRGLKIPALQKLLAEKHLSLIGKKRELQERLLTTGLYSMETPMKKRKVNLKPATAHHDNGDSDDSNNT